MSRKLSDVLSEVHEKMRTAATNLEEVPRNYRDGWSAKVGLAKEALPGLLKELEGATVPSRLVGMFATGDAGAIQRAADFLKTHGGAAVDVDQWYVEVAKDISAQSTALWDRWWRTTQHGIFARYFLAQVSTYFPGAANYPNYVERRCPEFLDLVDLLRDLTTGSVGENLVVAQAKDLVMRAVVQDRLDGGKVPVLVYSSVAGAIPPQLGGLFSKVVNVELDAEFEPSVTAISNILKNKPLKKPQGEKQETQEDQE